MNYLQALFSIFNAPLFATFIIGMFWKRMTPAAGLWGLIAGTITAAGLFVGYKAGWIALRLGPRRVDVGRRVGVRGRRDRHRVVTLVTQPKPVAELQGLVYGMANDRRAPRTRTTVVASRRSCWASRRSPALPPDHLFFW